MKSMISFNKCPRWCTIKFILKKTVMQFVIFHTFYKAVAIILSEFNVRELNILTLVFVIKLF